MNNPDYDISVNNTAVYVDGGSIQNNLQAEQVVSFLKRNNLWASCVGLWMPQSGLKKDANQLVSKMYDIKSNNHAVQTTGSYQPSYNNASLLFDGVDDFLQANTGFLTGPSGTAFYVYRPTATPDSYQALLTTAQLLL
jgi:hypothetical protein